MKLLMVVAFLFLTSQAHALKKCRYGLHGVGTKKELSAFLGKLKKVKTSKQLAQYVNFPLRVILKKKPYTIKNKSELRKHYKTLMSEKVRSHIYYADPKKVYCNNDGIMLGKGQVWIGRFKDRYKIISMNP